MDDATLRGRWLVVPVLALVLGLAAPPAASAQQGAISGRVTRAQNQQPVSGAQVFVVGQDIGTLTDQDGNYRLTGVPAGERQVRVQVIGYENQTRTVTVQSGQATTVNFELSVAAVSLQDVVVTATGERRQREVGNAVTTVDVDEEIEQQAPADFTGLLQGDATGVTVQRSSGSIGTASAIRIRGNSTLGLSTTPIVYVDGVRINNDNEVAGQVGGQDISRLNDLSPQDIAEIEVIKGPAAATLYGTEASAGVIRITTKQGIEQDARFTFSTEQGVTFDDTNWWAMAFNPQRGIGPFLFPESVRGATKDTTYVQSLLEGTRFGDPFRTGHLQTYSASARGGGGGVSYFLSGHIDDQEGNLPSNKIDDWHTRGNANIDAGEIVDLQFSTQFNSTDRELPENDNNLFGVVGNALGSPWWGPMRRDGVNTCFLAFELARAGAGDLSSLSDDLCEAENPFFISTFDKIFTRFNEESVERFIGSGTATIQPTDRFRTQLTIGADLADTELRQIVPVDPDRPFFDQSAGLVEKTDRTEKNITLDGTARWTQPITDDLTSQTIGGFQWFLDQDDISVVEGRNFPAGSPTVSNSVTNTASDAFVETKTLGFFFQEQLAYQDKLFLTPGIRFDDNSAFGENLGLQEFFQVNGSYVMSEEEWFPSLFSQFRLRAAYGESAKQPGSNDALALLQPTSVRTAGGERLGVTPTRPGNPELRPETGEEFEVGFDASLFQDRLGVQFTYYDQTTNDAIVQRPLAPSTGFPGQRFENVAEISNRGVELSLDAAAVQREDFNWNWSLSLTTNDNEITELPEPIVFGAQQHKEGFPFGAYFARDVSIEDGSVVVSDTARFQGNPTPEWEGALSTSMRFFDRVSLYVQGDYAGGHALLNGTEDFNCGLFGGGGFFGGCPAMFELGPNGQPTDEARIKQRASAIGSEAPFISDADYLKLRTVTLRFRLPRRWLEPLGVESASLRFTGENMATWTSYQGTDPEVNFAGSAQVIRQQFIGLPAARRFTTGLQFTL